MKTQDKPIFMDRTLAQDIGDQYGTGPEKDLFGVEVELEGIKVLSKKADLMKWWTIHNDGSLRANKPGTEAIEYVFNKPHNMANSKIAIKTLFDYLTTNPGTQVFESYRTSIHVHVNCLQETIRTIVNFITLSIIFDELFVSQNGEYRIGNNFCLRAKDAEGQVADLCNSVQNYGSIYNIQASHRYSSTNMGSLLKFGTIEFRSLECTTDLERVMRWMNVIQGLKVAAREYENPKDIIAKFSRRGPLGFMIGHLGEAYGYYAQVPGAQNMLRNGMRLAQDFAYCSRWEPPPAGVEPKPKRGAKNYDDLLAQAQHNFNYANLQFGEPVPVGGVPAGGVPYQPGVWAAPPQPQPLPIQPAYTVPDDIDSDDMDDDDDL